MNSRWLEVNLKKSNKFFQRSQPQAASMISVAREMSALDLLSYHTKNQIACANVSQSLHCMPVVPSHLDPLPCLTRGSKFSHEMFSIYPLALSNTNLKVFKYPTSYWGPVGNSWCCQRTRMSPVSSLGVSWWFWWGFRFTGWLALMILLRKCFGFKNHDFQQICFTVMFLDIRWKSMWICICICWVSCVKSSP